MQQASLFVLTVQHSPRHRPCYPWHPPRPGKGRSPRSHWPPPPLYWPAWARLERTRPRADPAPIWWRPARPSDWNRGRTRLGLLISALYAVVSGEGRGEGCLVWGGWGSWRPSRRRKGRTPREGEDLTRRPGMVEGKILILWALTSFSRYFLQNRHISDILLVKIYYQ